MLQTGNDDIVMPLLNDVDVLKVRKYGKELAAALQFSTSERTIVATAISEIARNTVLYAKAGAMHLRLIRNGMKRGLMIVATDEGPGIPDLKLAMQDGYTTSRGLGIGLPGAKRLMDEFDIVSEVGKGTVITMKKWER
ncbi:anti-sigma regulatory factor [Noviherbaspirillum denitrificans]|nr:anti-sigma regulatory factor [Noviherbaspirillum denitrificans]